MNVSNHPCFGGENGAKEFGRIHLAVAPACNIQCNYCRRAFDCANESRPGVASKVITPYEAQAALSAAKQKEPRITVAGIAGPGDALANAEAVLETLRVIRATDSDVLFCVSTNGLLLPRYAQALREAGVSHITVTVNAATVQTAQKIYRYADYDGRRYTRAAAAELILQNQIEGIRKAAALGMLCKINVVAIPELNMSEIPAIMRRVKEAGASIANIMPLIPVEHTLFENMPRPSHEEIAALRAECEPVLPQMTHCRHCRADAEGMLGASRKH